MNRGGYRDRIEHSLHQLFGKPFSGSHSLFERSVPSLQSLFMIVPIERESLERCVSGHAPTHISGRTRTVWVVRLYLDYGRTGCAC